MSKCGRNVVKTRRYDSVPSPLFFLFFNLIKTAAKFKRNESVKCPARAVFTKSRSRHVHIMSLNLLTSHKSPPMSRVSYIHSSRTTNESLHYFVLPRFRSLCRLPIPANIVPRTRDCTQELIPLDISYDQIFLQRSTQNFEIRRRVSRVKKTN